MKWSTHATYIYSPFNFASRHYIHICMNDFLESIKSRDPAAKSVLSIVLTGVLFAIQGFVSTGISYDSFGWFNF